jgi:hypothetical protein
MTINHSFNDNILAISIKIDELITSIVTLAKAMKTSYVICSRNGWLCFYVKHRRRAGRQHHLNLVKVIVVKGECLDHGLLPAVRSVRLLKALQYHTGRSRLLYMAVFRLKYLHSRPVSLRTKIGHLNNLLRLNSTQGVLC